MRLCSGGVDCWTTSLCMGAEGAVPSQRLPPCHYISRTIHHLSESLLQCNSPPPSHRVGPFHSTPPPPPFDG